MGKLIIKRDSGYADAARKYKVVCNGKPLGKIANGETQEFSTEDTDCELFLKIDWCRSNKIQIQLDQDQVKNIECGSSLRGGKLFLAIIYVFFMPHKYLWIKESS